MTVVDLCQRLIRAESTPGREGDAIAIAAQAMRDRGFDDVAIDRYGNLIGRVGPERGPALLIDGHIDTAAWETPRDHPLVATALAATGAEASTYQFGTNGSYFAGERGIPTVGYGPADPGVPHTVDESIPIDQLERAPAGYRDIAFALLGDGA